MPKNTWWFASFISVGFVLALLLYSLHTKTASLEKAQAEATAAAAEAGRLKAELAQTKEDLTTLQEEKKEAVKAKSELEKEMRTALESKDITISELQGKLEVNILDRVLFDTGKAELKPGGAEVLMHIANILTNYPARLIHVIGHTDNVPIRANAYSKYADNWELSAGRAIAAVRFLQEKAGVDPRRLAAVGYGEHHPIADNSTPEGRAKNRRIALVVLPEVFDPEKEKMASPTIKPESEPKPVDSATPPAAKPLPEANPVKAIDVP